MRICFTLEPEDIQRFEQAMARARRAVRSADENELVESARHALDALPLDGAPGYVRKRIAMVWHLIEMLEDEAWSLPVRFREEVVGALVYFSDPDDLIPDHVPVIGLLDDAIMLELLVSRERDLLMAYDRFCRYRERLGSPPADAAERKSWQLLLSRRRARLLQTVEEQRHRARRKP